MSRWQLWRVEYDLLHRGIPMDRWEDFWQATHSSGLESAQDRRWKLVSRDYSIADFTVEPWETSQEVWPPTSRILLQYRNFIECEELADARDS